MATKAKTETKAASKTTVAKKTTGTKTPAPKKDIQGKVEKVKKVDKLSAGDIFKQGDRTRGTMVYEVLGDPIKKKENPNEMVMETKIISSTKKPKIAGAKEQLHFQKRLSQWKSVEMVKNK